MIFLWIYFAMMPPVSVAVGAWAADDFANPRRRDDVIGLAWVVATAWPIFALVGLIWLLGYAATLPGAFLRRGAAGLVGKGEG